MDSPRYEWRRLTKPQREEVLARRKREGRPWHSPPHRPSFGRLRFHITAACYEHAPFIGRDPKRMDVFARELLASLEASSANVFAWCVLPNHYHVLVESRDILGLLRTLGRLHGRTSHTWNADEHTRGRKVFFRAAERAMKSDGHFFATLNYVHHNAVHHGYVKRWSDWPWSSSAEYLELTGEREAERVWRKYPVKDYGRGWDEPDM